LEDYGSLQKITAWPPKRTPATPVVAIACLEHERVAVLVPAPLLGAVVAPRRSVAAPSHLLTERDSPRVCCHPLARCLGDAPTFRVPADATPIRHRPLEQPWAVGNLPNGVELLFDAGTSFRLKISMPAAEENRIVVRCPTDSFHRFAIQLRFEGEAADEIHCVACGHREGVDAFLMDETRQRIIEIAQATTAHQIGQQMRAMGFDYRPSPIPKVLHVRAGEDPPHHGLRTVR
jgi:hypothetical protein